MQTDPFGVVVDSALILAAEDRRQRSARALAAAAIRFTERRAADQAYVRAAVEAYAATSHLPVGHVAASRPAI